MRLLCVIFGVLTSASRNSRMLHFKSRCEVYPRSENKVKRLLVPDDKVSWVEEWDYNPPTFTAAYVLNKTWSDPEIGEKGFEPMWHRVDNNIDRRSFTGEYRISNGYPLNPIGRTGLRGRGVLGRWGPNHAADPIVTSWKRDDQREKMLHPESNKPILQFLAIKRRDNGEWAIPGGMVDPGELVSATLKREFFEETLNFLEMAPEEKSAVEASFNQFFSKGEKVYEGYVDDPRNTDNAWMETVACNFHDETGETVKRMTLKAGDDAVGVQWTEISSKLLLYASHINFIDLVVKKLGAHW